MLLCVNALKLYEWNADLENEHQMDIWAVSSGFMPNANTN